MPKEAARKVQTDIDVKRKAVKLVIVHLKRKIPKEFLGSDHVYSWITGIEKLLEKRDFSVIEIIEMRKGLNDVIERTLDEE